MAYEASITPSYIKGKVPRGELFLFLFDYDIKIVVLCCTPS